LGQGNQIQQEYQDVTKEEAICQSAQETMNIIIDYNRETYKSIQQEEFETDKNLIDKVSSKNLITYLTRKNKVFMLCMMKPLTKNGLTTLSELIQSYEYKTDERLNKTMKIIISTFPETLVNISKCHNEEINSDTEDFIYMLIAPNMRKNIHSITVKELQVTLKNALKKIEALDVKNKLGIDNFDEENITRFRHNIYFRLVHNGFFTHVRMKKYRMRENDECPRCNMTETTKHLLCEKKIWKLFNDLMNHTENGQECINNYENVFRTCEEPAISIVKAKIIQALIQIERPINWNREKLLDTIKDLINVEEYNAVVSRSHFSSSE
jgi:hypothetical protein